ncbi:hypothetical protein, partial [Proteus mirabilis]|uniref:hypothetical protein n=1 Tax=Proteus mirabilis TaxID=584 RepID=UPI003C6DE639
MNNAGQVTGSSRNADEFTGAGFLYSNGQMTGLGTLGGSFSTGWAINDAGQIAGDSWTPNPGGAFLYSKGVMNDLGTLGG